MSKQKCQTGAAQGYVPNPRKGPRWPVIDTTNGGLEETAAKVGLGKIRGAGGG